jgi:hypothetical protein
LLKHWPEENKSKHVTKNMPQAPMGKHIRKKLKRLKIRR